MEQQNTDSSSLCKQKKKVIKIFPVLWHKLTLSEWSNTKEKCYQNPDIASMVLLLSI